MNNLEVYKTKEDHWGKNQNNPLVENERKLIDKYLLDFDANILEAGCGGGRITLKLVQRGHEAIDAFDYNSDFVTEAKKHTDKARFFEADAADLFMLANGKYEYLLYMAQVLCFLPKELIAKALEEAHRVGRTGGCLLVSFLHYDGRWYNGLLSAILFVFRKIRGERKSSQELPWLRHKGKTNWNVFSKDEATNYWFKEQEAKALLDRCGFEVVEELMSGTKLSNSTILHFACRIK